MGLSLDRSTSYRARTAIGKRTVRTESTLTNSLPITEVVTRIVTLNKGLHDFWRSNHQGWPPSNVADLLSRSRLDWQVSLSYSLKRWIDPPLPKDQAAAQILGYAIIGSLVEGTLKLLLITGIHGFKESSAAVMQFIRLRIVISVITQT